MIDTPNVWFVGSAARQERLLMTPSDVNPLNRAVLAVGTASYDSADFSALDKVPMSLRAVVATLTGLGFTTVDGPPGYRLDPVLADVRAAVRQAAAAAPVVVVYYTGHGVQPELDDYYLVSQASQPGDFSGTALPAADLPRLLTRRTSDGEVDNDQPLVLVILDCCYSGRAGMEMLGEALRGVGNPRLWAIASAGALEYARQGQFAAAFCDALERPTTGPSTQFLSMESIVQVINDARAGHGGQEARVFPPATGATGIPPFFPNKHYQPGLAGLTVSEQHWLSRVRAAPRESTTGFYLTGRTGRIRAVENLIDWMTDTRPGGLAVVTGSPGTGKSTLLALPVLLAQPDRRANLLSGAASGSLIERAAARLPTNIRVAAVHARGLNTDQAARIISQAFDLVAGGTATLLQDLESSPRLSAIVVIDALDEAISPPDMIADLLLPLGRRAGLRVAVGGRRHAVPTAAQLTIDLDRPEYHDPEALTEYLRRLLVASEEPGVRTPYQEIPQEITATVARAIALRATSSDKRTESFLIGRILALSVRGRPKPADVTDLNWEAKLPAELTEAFDEDLGRLGDRTPVARILLQALAWAQGPGLPWENIWVPVARALAGHDGPLITNDDVRWLLDRAAAYVVEDLGPGQRSVYRPFHDVLAAYLRGKPTNTGPDGAEDRTEKDVWHEHQFQTEKVITNALLETVPADAEGQRQWDFAHPYLRTYLVQHAAETGIEAASTLVEDKRFLAVTDQSTFSPYRGLMAFGPADAPFFFGRGAETARVVARMAERIDKPEMLIVAGPSGVGKSSLLKAGVLPAVRGGGLPVPGSASWPSLVVTPGHPVPLASLARIAIRTGTGVTEMREVAALQEEARMLQVLRAQPDAFAHIAHQAALASSTRATGDREATRPAGPRLLLIVDQFEELFTARSDEAERQAFITAVHAAATTRTGPAQVPPALVVLVLRADFFAHCIEYPQLIGALQDPYVLEPMRAPEARQAITGPAQMAGLHIEAGLVDVLLDDAVERSGTVVLPLLSYALDQTWRSRVDRQGTVFLTIEDYMRAGGIRGAVASSAESIYNRLSNSQQAMARGLFMHLIVLSEDGMPTARPATREDVIGNMVARSEKDLLTAINAFAGAGLLALTHDSIAITHEVLLIAWPRLREWLDTSRTDLIVRSRLRDTAIEWRHSAGDPAYLYTGSVLESAQAAVGRIGEMQLTPNERDFLRASMRSLRRSTNRQRLLTVLLLISLIVLTAETIILLAG